MVKKFISLLLISVCLGDTLILKDKTARNGTLINFVDDEIMFEVILSKNSFRSKFLTYIIDDIQELKLYDGTMVIENGIIVATNEEHIKSTSYDRYLNISNELKKEKLKVLYLGCAIISVAAIGGLLLWIDSLCLGLCM